ncbi:TetR family transcriptional regulator [Jatrophihabitans sp. GAS493]|uniref:TetR/AcrR family transcriptional regulator n=1 Tax=Jatrophihabitans sp. GAS493 TaxID=1907575 RepID=UPI000BB6BE78|nr:TetR/AcrR family transcriptional regulator [Jatrophihabitans sp. GAS493]SOD73940.1 TetR family transcriptional regulator [Jatrophihabitans sp. GAS493]
MRQTHAERNAATRKALLEATARGLAHGGYGALSVEAVAREAGYSRGAVYHQFADKEALVIAAVQQAEKSWRREVGVPAATESDPVAALVTLARGHAVYCRRDVARLLITLRVEFYQNDHPVGRVVQSILDAGIAFITSLVAAGRANGSIPAGAPDRLLALAYYGALEGTAVHLAGEPGVKKFDELLAERAVLGVLGIANP